MSIANCNIQEIVKHCLLFPRNGIEKPQQQPLVQEQQQQGNNLQVPEVNNVNQENEAVNDPVGGDLHPGPDAGVAAVANDGLRARRRHSAFAGTPSNTPASDITDERLSGLRMVWVVLSSLFTSLIPEQPQVNFH